MLRTTNLFTKVASTLLLATALSAADKPLEGRLEIVGPRQHCVAAFALGEDTKKLPLDYGTSPVEKEPSSPLMIVVPYKGEVVYPDASATNVSWVIDYQFRSDKIVKVNNISFTTNSAPAVADPAEIDVLVAPITYKTNSLGEYIITTYGSALGSTSSNLKGKASAPYTQTNSVHNVKTENRLPVSQTETTTTSKEPFTGVLFMYYLNQIPKK